MRGARRQDTHVHTTARCGREQLYEATVGREVRIGDVERFPRSRDGHRVEARGSSASEGGSRVKQSGRRDAVVVANQSRATRDEHTSRLDPRRGERGLKLSDRRALEPDIRLAPRAVRAPVAEPLVIDAEPSGPSHPAIDHNPADVRTMLREMKC